MVFHISLISWLASYGIAGWINAGGEANRDIQRQAAESDVTSGSTAE